MAQGTPCSSQLIWYENRVAELEANLTALRQEVIDWLASNEEKVIKLESDLASCKESNRLLCEALDDKQWKQDGDVSAHFRRVKIALDGRVV